MSTNIRERIDQLLSTEMDRTDFLKVCGVAILAAVGVTGILKALAGAQSQPKTAQPQAGSYGGRAFGE